MMNFKFDFQSMYTCFPIFTLSMISFVALVVYVAPSFSALYLLLSLFCYRILKQNYLDVNKMQHFPHFNIRFEKCFTSDAPCDIVGVQKLVYVGDGIFDFRKS